MPREDRIHGHLRGCRPGATPFVLAQEDRPEKTPATTIDSSWWLRSHSRCEGLVLRMVRGTGLEPARPFGALGPQPSASANSATRALEANEPRL